MKSREKAMFEIGNFEVKIECKIWRPPALVTLTYAQMVANCDHWTEYSYVFHITLFTCLYSYVICIIRMRK